MGIFHGAAEPLPAALKIQPTAPESTLTLQKYRTYLFALRASRKIKLFHPCASSAVKFTNFPLGLLSVEGGQTHAHKHERELRRTFVLVWLKVRGGMRQAKAEARAKQETTSAKMMRLGWWCAWQPGRRGQTVKQKMAECDRTMGLW